MKSQTNRLSGSQGAYLACSEEETTRIQAWLIATGRTAIAFANPEDFTTAVEDGRFGWVAVVSAGRALVLPDFDRLFRAVIETDTELWSADDDKEVGTHLFCSMVENWEFLAPYVPEATEATSLTSLRDVLTRIEARIRLTPPVGEPTEDKARSDAQVRNNPTIPQDGLVLKEFTVHYKKRSCFLGNTIPFHLLERLSRKPGQWFSFSDLKADVWPELMVEDATVGRTARLLSTKLKEAGLVGVVVETPRNVKHHVRLVLK